MKSPTILIAEDEPIVRGYIASVLRREGFQIIEAGDGVEALEQIEQHGWEIDLLVTDIRMPRMDGVTLARAFAKRYPGTPIIYISGYPFEFEDERARHPNLSCAFLMKPFAHTELLEAIRKCLDAPTSPLRNRASVG